MRDISEIRADLSAAKNKRNRLGAELTDMAATADSEIQRSGWKERYDRLQRGYDRANDEVTTLEDEWKTSVERSVRSGYVESGDGATIRRDRTEEYFHANLTQAGRPYDRREESQVIDRAKRITDSAHRYLSAESGDQVHALLDRERDENWDSGYLARRIAITESRPYKSGLVRALAAGQRNMPAILTAEESEALRAYETLEGLYERGFNVYTDEVSRAMSENVTTAGGFGVPSFIDPSIILTSGAADVPLLRICRVEQVTNNLWLGISSAGMSWSYTTEGTEVSDNSPTLAQPSVRVHMPKGFLPYSIEVAMDVTDFMGQMSTLLNAGYNDLLAVKTMQGSGSGEPAGVFVALSNSTSVITPTTDGQFGGADIFKCWNTLPERFRANATWVMSIYCQSQIRQFAANQSLAQSAYFTVDLTGSTFRINERPVIITDYAPTGVNGVLPGTTGLQNVLAVSDFRQSYVWANRMGMAIEPVPLLMGASNRFPTGQRGLFAYARHGGGVVAQRAGVLLQNQ